MQPPCRISGTPVVQGLILLHGHVPDRTGRVGLDNPLRNGWKVPDSANLRYDGKQGDNCDAAEAQPGAQRRLDQVLQVGVG
jgi:hypothetical protein